MTEVQEKFIDLLKKMFQFDQADLDFGIYKIMNAKHAEIEKFLNEDLPHDIDEGLQSLQSSATTEQIKKIEEQITTAKSMDLDQAMKDAMIQKLEEQKAKLNAATNIESAEDEIYNNLLDFFSRYYEEGDFISQRRYSKDVYAIPYEGEEVKLHWANADQYYIKTSEYFKDYTFSDPFGNKAHFKILDAETEQNNNKSKDKKFFQLTENEKKFEVINGELFIYVEYRTGTEKYQKTYNSALFEAFKKFANEHANEYQNFISMTVKEKGKESSLLEKQLTQYTAKNTFDYFIHKDLKGFLSRELDFYIKNEVIRIDDIDENDEPKTKQILTKAKVLRNIAKQIIAFLAQLEDFQKKLFLKKKFIIETNYCITLDKIDEKFYPEIASNEEQRKEWVKLFAINEIKSTGGDMFSKEKIAYSEPLTVDFLKDNPYLVLDTAFFNNEFKEHIVEGIDDLDENINGQLIYSENFQALNLLQNKYASDIQNIVIDPPYNTGDDDFIYKDGYSSSSWLCMINDRITEGMNLLKDDGSMFICIGDEEQEHLATLIRERFGKERYYSNLVWEKKKKGSFLSGNIAKMKDYIACVSKNEQKFGGLIGEIALEDETYPCVNASNPRDTRIINYPLESTYREKNYTLQEGSIISAGNMTIKLLSDLVIKNGKLVPPLKMEGNWRYSQESMEEYAANKELYVTQDLYLRRIVKEPRYKRQKDLLKRSSDDDDFNFKNIDINNLDKNGWGTNEDANDELMQLLGTQYAVSYPKPSKLFLQLICSTRKEEGYVLDYFAGSGTTGQAVINLNRIDGKNRKFLLCEMGDYFDTVVKPRIEKVIYSSDWENGKPVNRAGLSNAFKYIRLESYEDTLNNITLKSNNADLMDSARKDYVLNYMMDFESKESDSLLNIEKLAHPFDYTMKITRKQECKEQKIDLVETFNYLIGLNVTTNYAMQTYDAEFSTGEYGAVSAKLKTGNTYTLKMIEGVQNDGSKVLVIWRNLTGDAEKDNAVLDAFFSKKHISSHDFEFDKIYVNGDNNLQNVKKEDENWKVVLIESEMKKLMFQGV